MRAVWRCASWLASLAVMMLLAGCAPFGPVASGTPSPSPAQATATMAAALQNGYVCANPPGSSAYIAYVDAKGQLYVAQGCAPPTLIPAPQGRDLIPIAFSTQNGWLLVWNSAVDSQAAGATNCLAVIDLTKMTLTTTSTFCNPAGPGGAGSATAKFWWYSPIGWTNDNAFYLAETAASTGNAVTVAYVALPGLAAVPVTTIPWVANLARVDAGDSGVALAGGALYYGGYRSSSEGGAWLHRFTLGTRADTRIVRLGLAGSGGCQAQIAPCRWTGPWDVTPNGGAIAYHSPGPRQSFSDTDTEAGTPLMLASTTGGRATQLFPGVDMGQGFAAPMFSAGGAFVAAMIDQRLVVQDIDNGKL
ncbi:MAG: hypothetical protein KGO05_08240, partial [Chloroflexota bacterium]|nr:hypothetical protein [Chloroflexota bacterium]